MGKWKFTNIKKIEDYTFNPILEKFYKLRIDGLVRENIQNSLDAKLENSPLPVKVMINLEEIETKTLPGIDEILERIPFLIGKSYYTEEAIENMKKNLEKNSAFCITFEDENTKGLLYNNEKTDTWKSYAYTKGVHNKDKRTAVENLKGGSHGVGKIASNAASEFFLMYFSNCDENNKRHIGGTIQLIEHIYNNEYWRSTGYFTEDLDNEIPYENNEKNIFEKNTRGLKIIVPYYKEGYGNEKEIIKSVCDSFFVAILENKLEVSVNGAIINKNTISDYILENEEYYSNQVKGKNKEFTPLYFKTFTEINKEEIVIADKNKKEYGFDLYFRYDKSITAGRTGIIRKIGMKIQDTKIPSYIQKPYNAVLIPNDLEADKYLKSLENQSHTELSPEHLKNKKLIDNAKKFIKNIEKIIKEHVDNTINGVIVSKDRLNIADDDIGKILEKEAIIHDVGNSRIIKRKTLKGHELKEYLKKIDVLEKLDKEIYIDRYNNLNADKSDIYKISSQVVKRILVGNNEMVEIDMNNSNSIEDGKCNVFIKIVDGNGREIKENLELSREYTNIKDSLDGTNKEIISNKIENISIVNKKIRLIFTLEENYNKSLKFEYYLEV